VSKTRERKEAKPSTPGAARKTREHAPPPLAQSRPPAGLDPLQLYIWEINRYPLLSREEERELAIRYREQGDAEAARKLVTANLRLVVKIAMDFQRHWMHNLLDLIQEGNIGLMQAVKKFDPYREIKFSYYASYWIKAYILKFIIDNWKLVKVGTTQAQRRLFFNLQKEKERLISEGFEAAPKLISEHLKVKESEVIEMDQRLSGWEVSLEGPVSEDSREQRKDIMAAEGVSVEDALGEREVKELVRGKLQNFRKLLDAKELDILDHRLLAEEPLTLHQLGEIHHVSRERVRQIEARLLKRLRSYLREEISDFEELKGGF
jgi:RNA polymerase sigma-32 factor